MESNAVKFAPELKSREIGFKWKKSESQLKFHFKE
jgi:hypothetical protein